MEPLTDGYKVKNNNSVPSAVNSSACKVSLLCFGSVGKQTWNGNKAYVCT
jgi:hypothetical protein